MSSGFCWFITLTYDNEHLPMRLTDGKVYFDVSRRDVQLFHKRLRKLLGEKSSKYKYYLTSEYGTEFHRPHYHEIAFNIDKSDLPKIKEAWGNGNITVDLVTDGRIKYVTNYILEKLFVPDGCEPVFNMMSKGLGEAYISKYRNFHDSVDRAFVPMDGSRFNMPRYYKERIFTSGQRAFLANKFAEEALDKETRFIQEHGIDVYEKVNHEIRAQYAREVREKRKKQKKF